MRVAVSGPDGTDARCLLVDLPDHGRLGTFEARELGDPPIRKAALLGLAQEGRVDYVLLRNRVTYDQEMLALAERRAEPGGRRASCRS